MADYKYKYNKYKTKYLATKLDNMNNNVNNNMNNNVNNNVNNDINDVSHQYEVHVSEPWFSLIGNGKKTIEGRLNKGDFAKFKIGDTIIWNNKDSNIIIKTKIIKITKYPNFEKYLTYEGLNRTLPIKDVKSIEDGVNIYRQYYSEDKEKEYGVLAIELKKLK